QPDRLGRLAKKHSFEPREIQTSWQFSVRRQEVCGMRDRIILPRGESKTAALVWIGLFSLVSLPYIPNLEQLCRRFRAYQRSASVPQAVSFVSSRKASSSDSLFLVIIPTKALFT